ncbi:anaerobic ribonucleoside-triphosphate reductase [Halanaerobacter jeridensis]|uniref:Anaerobic ribonucleoside-triphosphate reductase n=1 Tax=Halanaerobacter jeridensis TaxID=706427 RepID=A0A939BRF6_9FIRM|nr:anaerobic ribonucleoside-triphosphate reductase [Halanaerobacter jeridensis]
MINYIKKRNGDKVKFKKDKIKTAVLKAAKAVEMENEQMAEEVTNEVVSYLKIFYKEEGTPSVEQVQDLVEKTLIEDGYSDIAKAYILYRDQHSKIRNTKQLFDDALDAVSSYLDRSDWKVKENSNMGYSLQGLNNHISSEVTAQYWLQEIYPQEIREKHSAGDLHIHDLGNLSVYCCGWDLKDLLLNGFGGVSTKVESKPPKHFRTALMQSVNFLYTLQGEAAGAMAFSNFDTYLAPFIAYDDLSYEEVKQGMQEFIYNLNVPTRVGFQCMSEDTEILTPNGWKKYNEVEVGETIKTFNIEENKIENSKVNKVFRRHYEGKMYNLTNRIQDQLISPKHRVVRKINNTNRYRLQTIEEVAKMKSPAITPITAPNDNQEIKLSDEEIKLIAWIVTEGSLEQKGNWRRLTIYQSRNKNRAKFDEIIALLDKLGYKYTINEGGKSLGDTVTQIRFNAETSRAILELFDRNNSINCIPQQLLNMSQRQSELFIKTYIKGDGHEGCKITTTDKNISNELQQIIINSGNGFTVNTREATEIGNKKRYIIRIIEHQDTYISDIKEVNYDGIIWCPNTDNETVIARRNGKVFITGNTPFTNITMDLNVPDNMKDEPIIVEGEPQDETYQEFQDEMDMLNRAFAEVMLEGDKKGRVFSFPIPTYNITPDFDWDNEVLDPVWEMTAKYGLPYFSNFVNSDMDPQDIRSMCCRLRIQNDELRKRGGGLFGSNPLTGCYDEKTEVMTKDGWKYFSELTYEDKLFTLAEDNQIELHKPKNIFEYDWEGELYRFDHKSLDLLVTPNHKMVYDDANTKERGFVRADEFNGNVHRIPKQGEWQGIEREHFILPKIENNWIAGNYNSKLHYKKEALKINMDLWLKFLGIFISEGCTDNENIAKSHGYRVTISQTKKKVRMKIKKLLDEMPFNYRIEGKEYIICSKQLWSYLKQFGNCYNKYIPKEIKALSSRQLKILFKWLMHGDGHIRPLRGQAKKRQMTYYTASKQLADDLQEIIMKIGYISTISQRNRGAMKIRGSTVNTTTQYTVGIQQSKHYRLRNRNIDTENYNGKVYCCEVENHTLMVRRNGKTTWCGNSVGVVTLNMPRIGYKADSKEEFIEQTYKLMDIAQESLEIKREVLENLTEQGLYPYSKFYLRNIKERFDEYWKNHFNTIGLNGMNEALENFMDQDISTPEGREFAVEVLKSMRDKLREYQEETGNIYNLEATPAEGTSYRFAKLDRERFGNDIICANQERVVENDADPYYTNSSQLPVDHTRDIFEAFQLQDPIQKLFTGGTVLHGFIGEKMPSIESTKKLVKRLAHNFELPYYSLTPTFSICPKHGYIAGEHEYCPKCDAEIGYEEGEE